MSISGDEDNACISHLSTSEIVGLSFIAESGVISAVAVLIFAALVIRNVIQVRRFHGPKNPKPLIRTHVDAYMISLMLADLLQGLGAIFDAKWAATGKVVCSPYCTAQGAMQQIGEAGVAMSTLVITLHTFATVFLRWQPSKWPRLWMFVVGLIWTFLPLYAIIGYAVHEKARYDGNGDPYFGPTPYWCWIGPKYMAERITGEYFWLWFAAITSIVLYPFLYFTLRGNIDVDPGDWRRIRFHRRSRDGVFGGLPSPNNPSFAYSKKDSESIKQAKIRNREAMKMFWYPITYTVIVGPLSINRWITFSSKTSTEPVADMSIVSTSICLFIFGLSGVINVLLFIFTRPNLLLFSVRRDQKKAQQLSDSTGVSFSNQYSYRGPLQRRHTVGGAEWDLDAESEYPGRESPYQAYPPPPSKFAPTAPPALPGAAGFGSPEKLRAVNWGAASPMVFSQDMPPDSFAIGPDDEPMEIRRQSPSRMEEGMEGRNPYEDADDEASYAGSDSQDGRNRRKPPSLSGMDHQITVTPAVAGSSSMSPAAYRSPSNESAGWDPRHSPPENLLHPSPPLPASLEPVYSRSLRMHRPSRELPIIAAPPEAAYPSPDSTRSRVEEWALQAEQERMRDSTATDTTAAGPS